MDEMTIADLAEALRGISRDAVILTDTPDGPRRLPSFALARVDPKQGGELVKYLRQGGRPRQ